MTPCPHLLDRIMAVMETAFDPAYGEAWTRRQVAEALVLPTTHALVVDPRGEPIPDGPGHAAQPVGFVLTRHVLDEEELLLIAVMPDARQHGIGAALIKLLFKAAQTRAVTQIFLEMRRGNSAIHLYSKFGFEPIGERKHYYRMANGERVDAVTFSKSI